MFIVYTGLEKCIIQIRLSAHKFQQLNKVGTKIYSERNGYATCVGGDFHALLVCVS